MAEFSMWWTTGGAGDGAATYTRSDHAMWSKVLASCNGMEGVAPNYLNKLVGAAGGANTVNIGSGGALVDGKVYNNSAVVAVNIPSAVGGGNTRIDRIVLRAGWTAQTVRITRIAGTDAASPVAPAITQSSGTTYDIMLCQVLVDTAGAVTVTDERTLAQVQAADIASLAVTSAKLAASAVISGKIATGGVSAAAQISNDVIDSQHYVDGSIDYAHLAAGASKLTDRQGGSASDWSAVGSTTYTPITVRMQAGAKLHFVSISAGRTNVSTTVTFPQAFSNVPLVLATLGAVSNGFITVLEILVSVVTATTATIYMRVEADAPQSGNININWLAIGPE